MPFQKLTPPPRLPRQWTIVGHPGSGKSTFAAQLAAPLLVIDADHRFAEVAHLVAGDVFSLSDRPADHVQAERIAALLKSNLAEPSGRPGFQTVVIDSLTAIVTPLVVEAILANAAAPSGRPNKNRVAAYKHKALAMRLLQDTVTNWGCDVLWIYHLRNGLDGHARQVESTTISAVELARLRRSLNLQLRIVEHHGQRGLHVEWARHGRSGLTLWDDTGCWQGMPTRLEQAVYGGLTPAQLHTLAHQAPTAFSGPEAAIAWDFEQGCFRDAVHAANAYAKARREQAPKTAAAMWQVWLEEVARRKRAGEAVLEAV